MKLYKASFVLAPFEALYAWINQNIDIIYKFFKYFV